MKKIFFAPIAILIFALNAQAASLGENQVNALALQLSLVYQPSPTQAVAVFMGQTNVLTQQEVSPAVTRVDVAYDFLAYPSDDETLQITGPASAYLGCKATVEFTKRETPAKIPDYDAVLISHSCEQTIVR